MMNLTILSKCKQETPLRYRIDGKEFILLNLEVPLTSKQPVPEDSIGAQATLNMGYKQFMQSK